MIDSRKNVSKTNKLIIKNWKNAFTAMKTASIPQKFFDKLGLVGNQQPLTRHAANKGCAEGFH
jgi:hypothetical protein